LYHSPVVAQRRTLQTAALTGARGRVAEGDLPSDESPTGLAAYLSTVSAGLAVQASAGASRASLHRVAERALRAFPDPHRPSAQAKR